MAIGSFSEANQAWPLETFGLVRNGSSGAIKATVHFKKEVRGFSNL